MFLELCAISVGGEPWDLAIKSQIFVLNLLMILTVHFIFNQSIDYLFALQLHNMFKYIYHSIIFLPYCWDISKYFLKYYNNHCQDLSCFPSFLLMVQRCLPDLCMDYTFKTYMLTQILCPLQIRLAEASSSQRPLGYGRIDQRELNKLHEDKSLHHTSYKNIRQQNNAGQQDNLEHWYIDEQHWLLKKSCLINLRRKKCWKDHSRKTIQYIVGWLFIFLEKDFPPSDCTFAAPMTWHELTITNEQTKVK